MLPLCSMSIHVPVETICYRPACYTEPHCPLSPKDLKAGLFLWKDQAW